MNNSLCEMCYFNSICSCDYEDGSCDFYTLLSEDLLCVDVDALIENNRLEFYKEWEQYVSY